jgi:ectoine hydroxylase-related dioxygenase (phytanoyl-CoA dioxygenase family)
VTASLPALTASDRIEAITACLLEHGGVIVRDLLEPGLLARLNDEVTPHLERADPTMKHLNPAVGFFFGERTRHVAALAAKSRTFATEVMLHPVFQGVCDAVLLPSCASYVLNLGHVIDRAAGSEDQMLHRDELVWIHVPRPHPELQVASMVAMSDFTADNGATRLVPGSHRWPVERQPEPDEVAVAEMPAGAGVVYLGSTIHGAGANGVRDTWRRGLHVSFVVGWLRTEENNVLAVPPSVARELPEASRALLGYSVHDAIADAGGYLGMVELRSPQELLDEGRL